jgi:hypothetical protein
MTELVNELAVANLLKREQIAELEKSNASLRENLAECIDRLDDLGDGDWLAGEAKPTFYCGACEEPVEECPCEDIAHNPFILTDDEIDNLVATLGGE